MRLENIVWHKEDDRTHDPLFEFDTWALQPIKHLTDLLSEIIEDNEHCEENQQRAYYISDLLVKSAEDACKTISRLNREKYEYKKSQKESSSN